jgi:hypothetical protein
MCEDVTLAACALGFAVGMAMLALGLWGVLVIGEVWLPGQLHGRLGRHTRTRSRRSVGAR